MTPVLPGQVWTLIVSGRSGRTTFRIDRIATDGPEPRAHGVLTASGKAYSFTVRCLERGHRSARLLRHADGTAVPERTPAGYRETKEERRSASDLVKSVKPKAVVRANERDVKIATLRAEGISPKDIATRFGIRPDSVAAICRRVRDARRDAAVMRRTGS